MRRVITILLALGTVGVIAALALPWDAFRDGLSSVRSYADKAIDPGPLTQRHAAERRLENCAACHDAVHGLSNDRCLECHKTIAERMAEKKGYHGTMEGECRRCHTDHRGPSFDIVGLDRKGFNHDQAIYHLRGKHADVQCARCHEKTNEQGVTATAYIGIDASACTSCHQDSHKGSLGTACASCHGEHGWKGKDLLFDHERQSTYKLVALHREVACAKCHKENHYKPIAAACLTCHKDPHEATLGTTCNACHTEKGWKGGALTFDHATQSRFKIDALHRSVSCAQCHEKGRYKPLETSCVACHRPYDAMLKGTMAAEAVPGPHATVSCEKCHEPGVGTKNLAAYRSDCIRCHNDRYGKLYLDWMNALETLAAKVEARIAALRAAGDDASAEKLSLRLRDARRVGTHNVPLAKSLLDRLVNAEK